MTGRRTRATVVVLGARLKLVPFLLVIGCALMLAFLTVGIMASIGTPAAESTVCRIAGGLDSPPPKLLPIYQAATERYKLGPRGPAILAAINKIESGFGTNMGPSSAGALGWMQFMPATWAAYGVDANRDGVKDPYDPQDAIFAAARYLRASGAPQNWHDAIFAYNHAEWYVEDVMNAAKDFDGGVVCEAAAGTGPLGDLPSDALKRVEHVARWIEAKELHYCWGGGHAAKPGPSTGSYCWNSAGTAKLYGSSIKGLDCSGAVRWLLTLSGYKDPGGIASGSFASAFPSGPGRAVTIWSNASHVFITIAGRDWGTSTSNFAHGPGFHEHTTAGFAASHPPGL